MKTYYAASLIASRVEKDSAPLYHISHTAVLVEAYTYEQAHHEAMSECLKQFPVGDGWERHHVYALPTPLQIREMK